jgi:hypothetical protein
VAARAGAPRVGRKMAGEERVEEGEEGEGDGGTEKEEKGGMAKENGDIPCCLGATVDDDLPSL